MFSLGRLPAIGHRRGLQQLSHVENFELVFVLDIELDGSDSGVEHLNAEGAGGAGCFCSGGDGFLDSDLVDPALALLFHPHVAPASAAAEALFAVARHLDQGDIGHLLEDATRRLKDVVVAAEVATVVVGDGLLGHLSCLGTNRPSLTSCSRS